MRNSSISLPTTQPLQTLAMLLGFVRHHGYAPHQWSSIVGRHEGQGVFRASLQDAKKPSNTHKIFAFTFLTVTVMTVVVSASAAKQPYNGIAFVEQETLLSHGPEWAGGVVTGQRTLHWDPAVNAGVLDLPNDLGYGFHHELSLTEVQLVNDLRQPYNDPLGWDSHGESELLEDIKVLLTESPRVGIKADKPKKYVPISKPLLESKTTNAPSIFPPEVQTSVNHTSGNRSARNEGDKSLMNNLPGTTVGQSSAEYWASKLVASGGGFRDNPLASTMLGLSVLWTPETAKYTAPILALPLVAPGAYALLARAGWKSSPAVGAAANVGLGYYFTTWFDEPYKWEAAAIDAFLGGGAGWAVGALGKTISRVRQAFGNQNLAPFKFEKLKGAWGRTSWSGEVSLSRDIHPSWIRKHDPDYLKNREWWFAEGPQGVLRHETIHHVLTPQGPLAAWRQGLLKRGYQQNHFLRAFEEGLAEGAHFQDVVKGFRALNPHKLPYEWRWGLSRDLVLRHGVQTIRDAGIAIAGAAWAGGEIAESDAYWKLREGGYRPFGKAPAESTSTMPSSGLRTGVKGPPY